MVSEATRFEIFSILQSDPENSICFDCKTPQVSYVSIPHSTLICNQCNQRFRLLPPQISQTKAISSSWTNQQLRLLVSGGNSVLKNYLQLYKIDQQTPIQQKYLLPSIQYYRAMLKCSIGQANCYIQAPEIPQQEKSRGFFSSAVSFTRNLSSSIFSNHSGQIQKLKNWKGSIGEKIKKGGIKMMKSLERGADFGTDALEWTIDQGEWMFNISKEYGSKGLVFVKDVAVEAYNELSMVCMYIYQLLFTSEEMVNIRNSSLNLIEESSR